MKISVLLTLGFEKWMTGGNCTALGFNLDPEGSYILLTDGDNNAPDDDSEEIHLFIYGK